MATFRMRRILHLFASACLGFLALAVPANAQPATSDDAAAWPAPVKDWKMPGAGEHPRLFFRKSDVAELRNRAETPEGKVIVRRLRLLLNGGDGESLPEIFNTSTKAYQGALKDPPLGKAYTLWHGAGYGMLFQLTGEKRFADLGRTCVEKALEGVRDRDDRYSFRKAGGALRAGPSIGAIAMAYDLCYDGWDEAFRQKVAKELENYNEGPNMSLAELAQGKRHGPFSNHWGPQIGGGALALLAIRNDPGVDAKKVDALLDANARTFVRQMTEGFGDGGYFHEHAGPGQIASDTAFVPALQAWKVAGGKDFIEPRPHASAITLIRCYEMLRSGGKTSYMIRHPSSYGSGTYPDDRDGLSRGGQFAQGFGAIKEAYAPALHWVFNHFVEPNEKERTYDTISPYPHRAVLALVNWPLKGTERNPAEVLPRVHHDSIKHYAVFRNRWKDGDDIIVTGLWGARNDGKESVMIWGLGERLAWGSCPKVKESKIGGTRSSGSGFIRAGEQVLGVDFSGASGADALIVWVGPGAGGPLKGSDKTAVGKINAGGTAFHYVTLSSTGRHPEAKADGDRLAIGGQTVAFDGKDLVFAK
jgi:hypothetical protein